MARVVQAGRGLDFDVIIDEFRAQLPLNTGPVEWALFTNASENHPVIAFERALLSLPMTLPNTFTRVVQQEADRVYAEFELVNAIGAGTTVRELTEVLSSRNTVEVSSRTDVKDLIEGLLMKDLIRRDGSTVRLRDFESRS